MAMRHFFSSIALVLLAASCSADDLASHLTGEWLFASDNPLKAKVGSDLELSPASATLADFPTVTNCVLSGDAGLHVGLNKGFKCYHGLELNSDYTIVMDVCVPDNGNKGQTWHGLLQTSPANNTDALAWLQSYGGKVYAYLKGGSRVSGFGFNYGEWRRVVITYVNDGTTSIYDNGRYSHTRTISWAKVSDTFFLLMRDDDREEYDTDVSYVAIYNRVLSADEIAEFHSRPLAQYDDGTFIPTIAPVGRWDKNEDIFETILGSALTAQDGGYVWSRAAAPAAATYVFNLTLPATQPTGGALIQNANSVASGVYGTSSANNGALTTTETPSATFASDEISTTWGGATSEKLDRTTAHTVVVSWPVNGTVRYYVDGVKWPQTNPDAADIAACPTPVMTFLQGLGEGATSIRAYDSVLTPEEIKGLGTRAATDPATAAITSFTYDTPVLRVEVTKVVFTVHVEHAGGLFAACTIDFGDGSFQSSGLVPSGTDVVFTNVYRTAGTMTPRVRAVTQDEVVGAWADGEELTVKPLSQVTDAVWTGAGTPGDLLDPRNWIAKDNEGHVIQEGVPETIARIHLTGDINFSCPRAGARTVYAAIVGDEPCRLTANCDWTGLDAPLSGVFDLNGRDLKVLEPVGTCMLTNSAAETARLKIDVSSGVTVTNTDVSLVGNLKLVKEGEGTFVMSTDANHTGGTEVAAGTCIAGVSPATAHPFGPYGSRIDVDAGAIFDFGKSTTKWENYKFFLNGGTLARTQGGGSMTIGDITLTADSTLRQANVGNYDDISVKSGVDIVWDLGGHTLTLAMGGSDPDIWLAEDMTIKEGTLYQNGWNSYLQLYAKDTTNASYIANSNILRLHMSMTLKEFIIVAAPNSEETYVSQSPPTSVISVTDLFRPHATSSRFLNTKMLDGSTLDLSARTTVFAARTGEAFANYSSVLLFDAGATVTVDLHGRTLNVGTQVVSWTTPPENVRFVPDAETAKHFTLAIGADGLYVAPKGLILIFR